MTQLHGIAVPDLALNMTVTFSISFFYIVVVYFLYTTVTTLGLLDMFVRISHAIATLHMVVVTDTRFLGLYAFISISQ